MGTFGEMSMGGSSKKWRCIFTCMATRVMHLEVYDYLMKELVIHVYHRILAVWVQNTIEVLGDNGTKLTDDSKILCLKIPKFAPGKFCHELYNHGVSGNFSTACASHVNSIVE